MLNEGEMRLLTFYIVLLTFFSTNIFAKNVALIIGNADYQHENKLENPINDAVLLQNVLKDNLKFDDIKLVKNANIRQLYQEINAFKQSAEGADVALIYFSGHGQQTEDKQNFLLATDAKVEQLSDLKISAISSDQFIEATQGAKTRLVILDACRDRPNNGFKSATKGLSRSKDPSGKGILIAYATEDGKVAQDGTSGNSPYAKALAQAMKNTDKSILAMFDEVADLVSVSTRGQQRPTRSGNLRVDTYFIYPHIKSETNTPSITPDLAFWNKIQNSKNSSDYKNYIHEYPNGQFVQIAQLRIEKYTQQSITIESPDVNISPLIVPEMRLAKEDILLLQKGLWRDPETNNLWMRCSLGQTWNGTTCIGNAKSFDWSAALDAVAKTNKSNFLGYNDWQLPEIEDLGRLRYCHKGFESSIEIIKSSGKKTNIPLTCKNLIISKNSDPMIDNDIFPNTPKFRNFWSKTDKKGNLAWQIFFGSGLSILTDKNEHHHVRLVRVSP